MHKLSILAAALLLVPAVSQAKTLEELLVEKGVITRGEAHAAGGGASKVYYNDGTSFEFPDTGVTSKFNVLIQSRYTFDDVESGQNTSSFETEIARLYVSGSALNKEFEYMLMGDWAGSPSLKDAYLTWHACDWAWLRMGQYKNSAVSRQFINSDHKLQFADRSIASDEFSLGRQSGLTAGGENDGLTWMVGILNGSSEGEGLNKPGVDTQHTGVLRLDWAAMGEMNKWEEGDIGNTADSALNVGMGYAYSDDGSAAGDIEGHNFSFDLTWKYQGWSLAAEYYHRMTEPEDSDDDLNDNGFYVQIGYFMDADWELAARYSLVSPDEESTGEYAGVDDVNEATVGINYYWWKHNLKAQINYRDRKSVV